MPDMSGMDLARLLRGNAALANTRLVALTGHSRDTDRQAATDAGFDAHVTKPVSAAQLTRLIAETD